VPFRVFWLLSVAFICLLIPVFRQTAAQSQDPPATTPQDDVVRVETDLVTTLFTALDSDRRFITNLRAEDVRILENGEAQEISLFERETDRPLTMVILVDTSRSQERTLPQEKIAAKSFIDAVLRPEKDFVAVVSFTARPKVESSLTNDPAVLKRAVEQMEVEFPPNGCESDVSPEEDPRCWTGLWDSIVSTVRAMLASSRKGGRRVIVVLTDGDDSSSRATRDEAIQTAVRNDVVIYGIGIGDPELYRIEKKPLARLTEKTGGRVYFPREQTELLSAFNQIQEEMRSQYVIAYVPKNRERDGAYRKLKIEITNPDLKRRKLTLVHRQGYYARQY
jgi:VWFA-related protein